MNNLLLRKIFTGVATLLLAITYVFLIRVFLAGIEGLYGIRIVWYSILLWAIASVMFSLKVVFATNFFLVKSNTVLLGWLAGLAAFVYFYIYNPASGTIFSAFISIILNPPYLINALIITLSPIFFGYWISKLSPYKTREQ